jgi:predicted ArsR family transcriptional regulator
MQKTRQQILDFLNQHGKATVQEITEALNEVRGEAITPVTVRHHLNWLQSGALIRTVEMLHQTRPGRPQYVYELTADAQQHFANNYETVLQALLHQVRQQMSPNTVNVIVEGMANHMAAVASIPNVPIRQRLDFVVQYLSEQGYKAHWEPIPSGYILHTSNCPYHQVAQQDDMLCQMDMRLVSALIGRVPRRLTRISAGDNTCSYEIPLIETEQLP